MNQRKVGTLDRAAQLKNKFSYLEEIRRKQKGKMDCIQEIQKTNFSIEIQQDYTRFTEVTALPPSFD
jgi:hypothetical protein